MGENEPSKYIEKIVLEILDRLVLFKRFCVCKESKSYFRHRYWFRRRRNRKIEKFNIARFNAREAAYAFLRKYNGQPFVKTQKVMKLDFFL